MGLRPAFFLQLLLPRCFYNLYSDELTFSLETGHALWILFHLHLTYQTATSYSDVISKFCKYLCKI